MHHAAFVSNGPELSICTLCPNHCRIAEGDCGACLGRIRRGGEVVCANYGVVVAAHNDPIEKKPLYHFYPGRSILSIGTYGCNLSCRFCQNSEISQQEVPGEMVSPQDLTSSATAVAGNLGVAFTYNEPGIWYEFILDTAPRLRKHGLKVVLVTNGYLSPAPWKELCAVTDAMNIDIKAFTEDFYRDICHGHLDPILENVRSAHQAGVHVEVTNLVIPGLNDNPESFEKMVDWLAALDRTMPLHLSRYFPRYQETAPPTPPETLEDFRARALKKLDYVFVGNVSSPEGHHSICPDCGQAWIERHGYSVRIKSPGKTCSCGRKKGIIGL